MNPKPLMSPPTRPERMNAPVCPDDLALVQATLQGDPGAIEVFVERLTCVARYLYSRNRRQGGVLEEHELCDLIQDVMTLLWSKRGTYLGQGPLEGWACGTALLQFYNCVRRQRRSRALAEVGALPEESLAAAEEIQVDRQQVHAALERLPEPERVVIHAKHYEDQSFTEIGAALDMSPNTAKTRYYRGLEQLRRMLARRPGEDRS